ncbi:putative ferric-chelate reductase 1 isoform X1 [Labrus bergylta]|uniref:putative ferric-chelate reductase 1 isoform X1 n=1 Tax=Labrus bergylta TaxID=56723 RepID=UPI0033137A23
MEHVVLLLVLVAPVVYCYSSGLVMDSCKDMRPHHSGVSPQTDPAPFNVTTDNNKYTLGEVVTVTLQATASIPFIGFLLQAREVGGWSPVGSFILTDESTQQLTCNQKLNSALSHKSESVKTSIQVKWKPEVSASVKPVQFQAAIVQNYRTFWVDVKSPALTFRKDSTGGSTSTPQKNSPTTTTALAMTAAVNQPAPPAKNISSKDCGVTKVCFSQPSNCDPTVTADCYFMSARALSPSDVAVHYEITGPSDGYIAIGFSDDRMMGNDDIYICVIGSNGLVQLQHAFSTGRKAPQIVPLGNVSDVSVSVQGRVISCSFTSMNILSTLRTTGSNKTYHILFAHGPSNNGKIKFHKATFSSTDKIDIYRPQLVSKGGLPNFIKAHGALMLIAWMTMGSVGMMVARYRHGYAKGKKLWGKDIWFVVHVAVMSLTVATTVIAFILPFSFIKAWSGGAHPVLGCLVMILSFVQITLALLRCGPGHPKRFLFNWTHALNGLGIRALSVAGVFTGLKLIDSSLDQWLMKVMGGFVGWEVLFFILLFVNFKWKVPRKDTSESKKITPDVLLTVLFFFGNLSFLVALLVGIGRS